MAASFVGIIDNPADMRALPVHIENVEKRLGCKFKITIADAGYGSEENYAYMNEKGIVALVKYGRYYKKHKKNYKKKIFESDNWVYDAEKKEYSCPNGQPHVSALFRRRDG